MEKDKFFMKKVLELAKKGEGYTSPNPLVAALVVKDNQIIGEGYHQFYGGPHAEDYALKQAGDKSVGATLYVNLEPCCHYGHTPPCSNKIIAAKIKRVVVGMKDPNPLVAGKGIKKLKNNGITVTTAVLEKEAKKLNEVFIKYITKKTPFVYLKTAQTLDGYLGTKTGDSKWITNQKARYFAHQLRHKVDAILVGIGTVLADDPSLTTRLADIKGQDAIRIILDSKLKIPLDAKVIKHKSTAKTIIVTKEGVNNKKRKLLEKKAGIEILTFVLDDKGHIPLKQLLIKLYEKRISSILVEGGAKVNYSFLSADLVDKTYNFIAPKLLGANDGIPVFFGSGPEKMDNSRQLKEVEVKYFDDNILLIATINGR